MRWFELMPHVGVNPDGSPQPLVEEGLRYMTDVRDEVTGKWIASTQTVRLRPVIPGGRVVQTDDPAVCAVLLGCGKWREVDPPKSLRPRRTRERQSSRRRK